MIVAAVPSLKSEIATAGLVELELLPAEDVPERLALSDYERRETVEAAFRDWLESAWQPWSEREKPRRDTIKLYNALYMLRQHQKASATCRWNWFAELDSPACSVGASACAIRC
jgi:hypothetical protein